MGRCVPMLQMGFLVSSGCCDSVLPFSANLLICIISNRTESGYFDLNVGGNVLILTKQMLKDLPMD